MNAACAVVPSVILFACEEPGASMRCVSCDSESGALPAFVEVNAVDLAAVDVQTREQNGRVLSASYRVISHGNDQQLPH